jgi:hypothetical protein
MQAFLDAFAETIADGDHVALVLDGAGWHSSKALRVPASITLVPLPPYSPELNPVERVWLHLKARFLSLRLLNDYKAIARGSPTPASSRSVRTPACRPSASIQYARQSASVANRASNSVAVFVEITPQIVSIMLRHGPTPCWTSCYARFRRD